MEMSQGYSLCSYFKLKKVIFFFYKIGEWVGNSGKGGVVSKGCGKVTIMQILCTHVCKMEKC
jgi:hypothetical protein